MEISLIPIGSIFISRNKKEQDNEQVPGHWNHICIWIGDNFLVEAQEEAGVIKTSLEDYLKRDYDFVIRYPKDIEIGKRASEEAVKLIGDPYRFVSSVFRRMRRDERGQNCVSTARKSYYRASNFDPKKWKFPDSLYADTIFLGETIDGNQFFSS